MILAEQVAISKLTDIPHQSIPLHSFATINLLGIKHNMNTLQWLSLAARCRVYLASDTFPAAATAIRLAADHDDALVAPPHQDWFNASMTLAIEEA